MILPFMLVLSGISVTAIAGNQSQAQATVLNADFMAIGQGQTPSTVLVGGTDGRLLRSADGGKTWQQAAIDSKYQIVQISARAQGAVLAIAQEGLLRSTDDGQHWDLQEIPGGQRISRLAFFPKTGQWIGVSMSGAILGSKDDGEHWQTLYQTRDSAPLTALTADNGYLVAAGAGGQVIFSADGLHWKPLATDTTAPVTRLLPLPGKGGVLSFWADSSVIAVPANGSTLIRRSSASQEVPYAVVYDSLHHRTLMATTKGHLHRSDNAGKNWQDLGSLDNILLTALLADAKDGSLTAIGARGTVARSTDGGKNWNILVGNQWGATLNTAAASPDGRHILAAGTGGLLMASDDRGLHWDTLAANIRYYVQDILPTPDHKAVLAIGEQGLVLRSTDSGQTWTRIATGMKPDVTLFSVIEHPRTHELLACGPMGTFLASSDGGLSWRVTRPVEEAGEGYLKQLVTDPLSGTLLAVASPGTVIRSDDAGVSWQATDADTSDKGIVTAAALGKAVFIATQGDGRILRSTDDGRHWTNTDITGAGPGNLYAEPVSGLAWIMARDAIYHSRDHGMTWQRSETPGITLNFLLRTPSGTLLGFGNAGAIIRSTDDGEHWASVASGTLSTLRKPLADATYGRVFVPGRDGTLLVSADDGLHWQGIETNTPAHLNRLWLSQDGKSLIVSGERIVHISLP